MSSGQTQLQEQNDHPQQKEQLHVIETRARWKIVVGMSLSENLQTLSSENMMLTNMINQGKMLMKVLKSKQAVGGNRLTELCSNVEFRTTVSGNN